ncbi:hypothetical protein BGW41_004339 [Actinomortierella wolfii]|nr:hypothetical protein BGW41_004339 [Actinomortierella wolfii]
MLKVSPSAGNSVVSPESSGVMPKSSTGIDHGQLMNPQDSSNMQAMDTAMDANHGRRNSCPADFIDYFQKGLLFTPDGSIQNDTLNTIQEDDPNNTVTEAPTMSIAKSSASVMGPQPPSVTAVPQTLNPTFPQTSPKHHSYPHQLPTNPLQTAPQSRGGTEWPPSVSSASKFATQPPNPLVPAAWDPVTASQLQGASSPPTPTTALSAQQAWIVKRGRTQPAITHTTIPFSHEIPVPLNVAPSIEGAQQLSTQTAQTFSGLKRQLDDSLQTRI